MVTPHPFSQHPDPLAEGSPLHPVSLLPISTGAVHESVIVGCVLVPLNQCVVCGSVLHRRHSGDGCLSSSILFKYECRVRHF